MTFHPDNPYEEDVWNKMIAPYEPPTKLESDSEQHAFLQAICEEHGVPFGFAEAHVDHILLEDSTLTPEQALDTYLKLFEEAK